MNNERAAQTLPAGLSSDSSFDVVSKYWSWAACSTRTARRTSDGNPPNSRAASLPSRCAPLTGNQLTKYPGQHSLEQSFALSLQSPPSRRAHERKETGRRPKVAWTTSCRRSDTRSTSNDWRWWQRCWSHSSSSLGHRSTPRRVTVNAPSRQARGSQIEQNSRPNGHEWVRLKTIVHQQFANDNHADLDGMSNGMQNELTRKSTMAMLTLKWSEEGPQSAGNYSKRPKGKEYRRFRMNYTTRFAKSERWRRSARIICRWSRPVSSTTHVTPMRSDSFRSAKVWSWSPQAISLISCVATPNTRERSIVRLAQVSRCRQSPLECSSLRRYLMLLQDQAECPCLADADRYVIFLPPLANAERSKMSSTSESLDGDGPTGDGRLCPTSVDQRTDHEEQRWKRRRQEGPVENDVSFADWFRLEGEWTRLDRRRTIEQRERTVQRVFALLRDELDRREWTLAEWIIPWHRIELNPPTNVDEPETLGEVILPHSRRVPSGPTDVNNDHLHQLIAFLRANLTSKFPFAIILILKAYDEHSAGR